MNHNDGATVESRINNLSCGDEWPFHYRGYGLSVNVEGDVWWQAYNGTDRLDLEPTPTGVIDEFLKLKPEGGALRVTEGGTAITLKESSGDSDDYETLYVGQFNLDGQLVPRDEPSQAIPVSPDGLDAGDLWTSVYDGSRYSFSGERFWWQDGEMKLRHSFAEQLPQKITDHLNRLRTTGGRFVITPQGDVVTQIPTAKTPPDVRSQFRDLPRAVKRFLQLRRDRGNVDMVPVYVGHLPAAQRPIKVEEPVRLTDPLSEQEEASLEAWVASMGSYEEDELSEDEHRYDGNGGGE
jgi:hypothetical protein